MTAVDGFALDPGSTWLRISDRTSHAAKLTVIGEFTDLGGCTQVIAQEADGAPVLTFTRAWFVAAYRQWSGMLSADVTHTGGGMTRHADVRRVVIYVADDGERLAAIWTDSEPQGSNPDHLYHAEAWEHVVINRQGPAV